MQRKRKVEEVFRITEENIKGRNPKTREPITIKRETFSCGELSFNSTYAEVERYLNLVDSLSAEEMEILYECLSSIDIMEEMESEDRYIAKKIKRWVKDNDMTLARFVYSINFLVDIFYVAIEDIAEDILDPKEYSIYKKIVGEV